uniref:Arsenite methyltransferase n=1 Tax=Candidatus Kentrum sp. LPFa TaxID=2126335 RepID=A0A450XJ37_9GAMM|nr:MAG: Ubiquinone/menaquinone biosynthesis C-methylase UbiE [Candidatus Kentron sp. LPFa]VFK29333.1 MAG: Ubiquinone/menaquinone biosynthesis C-methylase UbiE [Candidatus Kentron sp. LPFa]
MHEDMYQELKEYYGNVLEESKDLKSNVSCCAADSVPPEIKDIIADLRKEVVEKFYGCGFPIPPLLEGCIVLDLGSGTGRDAYIASKLVGESGNVIVVDMTEKQIAVAEKHVDWHMNRFGYTRTNIDFREGYIEDIEAVGIEDNSIDVVISNCVINLSLDKQKVFREIFRVLKPGGELYFSDMFASRRIPKNLRSDPVLYRDGFWGALYIEDFRRLMKKAGFYDYKVVSDFEVQTTSPDITSKIDVLNSPFHSRTIRAFELIDLEDAYENYGQIATYSGTIPGHPHRFELDNHHEFVTGKPVSICGNTASMLQSTRYAKHWIVTGDRSVHYGAFG